LTPFLLCLSLGSVLSSFINGQFRYYGIKEGRDSGADVFPSRIGYRVCPQEAKVTLPNSFRYDRKME